VPHASAGERPGPVLPRTSAAAGHGIGTAPDERVAQEADAWAFLFHQLEMSWDKSEQKLDQDLPPDDGK
jgi:hypothetical protein